MMDDSNGSDLKPEDEGEVLVQKVHNLASQSDAISKDEKVKERLRRDKQAKQKDVEKTKENGSHTVFDDPVKEERNVLSIDGSLSLHDQKLKLEAQRNSTELQPEDEGELLVKKILQIRSLMSQQQEDANFDPEEMVIVVKNNRVLSVRSSQPEEPLKVDGSNNDGSLSLYDQKLKLEAQQSSTDLLQPEDEGEELVQKILQMRALMSQQQEDDRFDPNEEMVIVVKKNGVLSVQPSRPEQPLKVGSSMDSELSISDPAHQPSSRNFRASIEPSEPGAISVDGIDARSSLERSSTIRIGHTEEEIMTHNQRVGEDRAPPAHGDVEELVQAQVVDEHALALAKPDPWYRRNQWWLAGGVILFLVAIILASTLTTIDLKPPPAPTSAPTTPFEGNEAAVVDVILAAIPQAQNTMFDQESPQFRALNLIVNSTFDAPEYYTERRILQQYSLGALFFATSGNSSWTRSDGWMNTTADECTWYGVTCSDNSTVTSLNLRDNGLSGSLPSDLSGLAQSLENLDLSGNMLIGSIAPELGSLSGLTELSLHDNRLSRPIPSTLGGLSSLQLLNVSNNALTSVLPTEIGFMTLLEQFDISNNYIADAVPSEIGQLSKLRSFKFDSNRISFSLPSELGLLYQLELLLGGSNSIMGSLSTEIGNLVNLKQFDLSDNLVFGTIPREIIFLHNLLILDLGNNLLSGSLPPGLGLLAGLETLTFGNNAITGVLPTSFSLMRSLVHLDLSYTNIRLSNDLTGGSDEVFRGIFQLDNLVTLHMDGVPIPFLSPDEAVLPKLETLGLSEALPWHVSSYEFLSQLSSLRHLDISQNKNSYSEIATLFSLTNLEVLDISFSQTLGSVPTEIGLLTNLNEIDLSGTEITGTIPPQLWGLQNLKSLRLRSSQLTGTIPTAIGSLSTLSVLDIGYAGRIYGALPSEIALLSELRELHLQSTFITGQFSDDILLNLTNLSFLDLRSSRLSVSVTEVGHLSMLTHLGLGGDFGMPASDSMSPALTGSVPAGLWSLRELRYLALAFSGGSAFLSPGLGSLSKLTYLGIQSMPGSTIPSEIGFLTELREIHAPNAGFQGRLPEELFHLSTLEYLTLYGNGLSGSIASELGLASNLKHLRLGQTATSGAIPTEIGTCWQLEILDLQSSNVLGEVPSEIGQLIFLNSVDLSYTNVSGPILPTLGDAISLSNFDASFTKISGSIPSSLGQASSLRRLWLAGTSLTGSIPSEIGNLEELMQMDLSDTGLTGAIPSEIERLSALRELYLGGNKVTGSISDSFACSFITNGEGSSPSARFFLADCEQFECTCCYDDCPPPTVPPSLLPTTVSSLSTNPSSVPSSSTVPSSSLMPSREGLTCSQYSSIATSGTTLIDMWVFGTDDKVIPLPFAFRWRGQEEVVNITVSASGSVSPVLPTNANFTANPLAAGIFPTTTRAFNSALASADTPARIAVVQEDLSVLFDGAVYSQVTDDNAIIISWEGVAIGVVNSFTSVLHPLVPYALYFQVVLYDNGNIEMRWGSGTPKKPEGTTPGDSFAAGVEGKNMSVPATGIPFDNDGITAQGEWPSFRCLAFMPTEDGLYEQVAQI